MWEIVTPSTQAEEQLLRGARTGKATDCAGLKDADKNVNPEFLRALLLGYAGFESKGQVVVPAGAIRLANARVNGELDLSHLGSISRPLPALFLTSCIIEGAIDLSGTAIGEVHLQQCQVHAIRAARANVFGQLTLRDLALPKGAEIDLDDIAVAHSLCLEVSAIEEKPRGKEADESNPPRLGTIALRRASVGGQLEITGMFCGAEKKAISAEGVVVAGPAILNRIDALGEVKFSGGKIGGQFELGDSALTVEQGCALNLDDAEIGGDLSLQDDLKIRGQAHFVGAKVSGQFIVGRVSIADAAGYAVVADRAEISDGVFLKASMTAHGEVRFPGAVIGGEFSIRGAELNALDIAPHVALNIQDASVGLLVICDGMLQVSRGENKEETGRPTAIKGIVHAYGLKAQGIVAIKSYLEVGKRQGLDLHGLLNFRNLKAGSFSLAASSLQPTDVSAGWHEDLDCVLSLSHAEIAGTLAVGLDQPTEKPEASREERAEGETAAKPSRGVIDLRGAKVRTLDDKNGAGWGKSPYENSEGQIASGVALLLDGLVYDRIETTAAKADKAELKPPKALLHRAFHAVGTMRRLRWILKADEGLIESRCKFVERMYRGRPPTTATFFPQPYRALAATLREMGHGYAARRVLARMERDAINGSPDSGISRSFSRLYDHTFGFGYSSWKAAMTLLAIWLLASGVFWVSKNYETLTDFFHAGAEAAITSAASFGFAPDRATAGGAGHPAAEKVMGQSGPPITLAEGAPVASSPAVSAKESESSVLLTCSYIETKGKVAFECRDEAGKLVRPPTPRVALRKIFANEQGPHEWAPACDIPVWLYALDVMVPVLNLRAESSCGFLAGAPLYWHLFRLFVTFAGAIAIPLAALTFSGLLQRE